MGLHPGLVYEQVPFWEVPVLSLCAKTQWDTLEVPCGLLSGMGSGLVMGQLGVA